MVDDEDDDEGFENSGAAKALKWLSDDSDNAIGNLDIEVAQVGRKHGGDEEHGGIEGLDEGNVEDEDLDADVDRTAAVEKLGKGFLDMEGNG